MKHIIIYCLLVWILGACQDQEDPQAKCGNVAIVMDLTGFDGCQLLLELSDGTRIMPLLTLEEIQNKEIGGIKVENGMMITVDFVINNMPTICMVGTVAEITCINGNQISDN